jgi:FAD/FMN-containing dehydrogenase
MLINLRNLNQISFNSAGDEATVQAGASISEVVDAAWANNARIYTGTCNCVGYLGANLGGGLGRLMGQHGLGVDQFISVNLINAFGQQITVTPSQKDLWWALRGAAPNFGIVTSATVKAYPIPQAQNTAWTGPLFYDSSQIAAVVGTINNLTLTPEMQIDFYYTTSGAPNYTPAVIALPFYLGNATEGKAAFASLYDIGPLSDGTTTLPYDEWNAAGDSFCIKGDRKSAYGASANELDPTTWLAIWDEYTTFLQNPNTGNTSILVECYSVAEAESIGATAPTAYPFRNVKFHAVAIPWYSDSSLDATANAFGAKVRDLIRSSDGLSANSSYINFAHGDDPLQNVYGSSLSDLQQLKRRYDPFNRFNKWFPLI